MHSSLTVALDPSAQSAVTGDPLLYWSGLMVAAGALLSGPLGLAVALIDGQPAWTDAATFIQHYRPWQQIPFWFGFLFIAAWVWLTARLAALAGKARLTSAFAMLIATAAYAAMIATNYTLQVALVPALAAARDANVSYITMANPTSFAWALEMFGYGALGVANWLSAGLFPLATRRAWLAWLMRANGIVGVAGAVLTAIDIRWVMTAGGLAAYFGWNALVIATGILIAVEFRPGPALAVKANRPEP